MKLSFQWLKQLIPDLEISPEKLGEILSVKTAEIEDINYLGLGLDKVVVGEILEIRPHPNADKLQIVLMGLGKKKLEIVCGASNIRVGQKVPLALEGAKLPNGLEIKKAMIRGVESTGMLCAEDELGLGLDHQGIMILSQECVSGDKLTKALGLDDIILAVENKSLTHRPDLFNHFGFAREISAILGLKINFKKPLLKSGPKLFENLAIEVKNQEICPRYMAVIIDGVKIGPSPFWLKNRLNNLGVKSINNVVDITNYVLLEIGQPLHAFDADKIQGNKIIIRMGKEKEKIIALDEQEYELSKSDLIIADEKKPIAIAGIIGGQNSAISFQTKRVIIEAANFDAINIRRSAWRLGLRTEAVIRFEKGLPLSFTDLGLARAIELIKEIASGKVLSQIYDFKSVSAKKSLENKKEIIFSPDKARRFIGLEIKDRIMKELLIKLGAEIKDNRQDWRVIIPKHRPDLDYFEDLIEEIVRVYGAEEIISQPILAKLEPVIQENNYLLEKKIKNILIGLGFDEVYNYAFAREQGTEFFNSSKGAREIENPLNKEQRYLRANLIFGLINNAEKNAPNFSDFKIFEIGKVFQLEEKKKIAGLVFNREIKKEIEEDKNNIYKFICGKKCFFVKSIIDVILKEVGLKEDEIIYPKHISVKEEIKYQNKIIGFLGKKNENISYFELDFEVLLKLPKKEQKYQKIITFPPVKRDLAFLIDKKFSWKEISQSLNNLDEIIISLEPFDLFQDKDFGEKYNLGFHIIYQSGQRTLKMEEVEAVEKRIIKSLQEKFGAKLRNY